MSMRFRVGVGRREITPPVGTMLTGYSPQRPAESVHDPLHVIAILIEQDDTRVLFAAMDLCNPGNAGTEIRQAMADASGVPFENVSYSCTHTHSGPVTFVTPPYGCPNPEWVFGTLVPMAAEAAKEAAEDLRYAEMGIGTVHSEVGINRRERTRKGTVKLGQEPLGLYDPTMTVVSFRDEEKKIICNLIHYGAHNTASGKNTEITRDWCGVMKDRLEEQTGGVTAFFNGCEGDCGPRLANGKTTGLGDISFAIELGGKAAIDACEAWRNIREWRDELKLEVLNAPVELPYEPLPSVEEIRAKLNELGEPAEGEPSRITSSRKGLRKRLAFLESGGEPTPSVTFPQLVFALGPFAFVASPFETFALVTMRIARHSPFANTLVVSQSNFRIGSEASYLPTQDQIPLGGYEVNVGYYERERPYRTDADQCYVAEVGRLLDDLYAKQREDEDKEE